MSRPNDTEDEKKKKKSMCFKVQYKSPVKKQKIQQQQVVPNKKNNHLQARIRCITAHTYEKKARF